MNHIVFSDDDVIIDCGANYGDLYLSLSPYMKLIGNYIAFEPNPDDFNILKSNIHVQSHAFNLALGEKTSPMHFYISSSNGDSSLIEPVAWEKKIQVNVIRLDEFFMQQGLKEIKLLKLEAEGFELEILKGTGDSLLCCEYIALDGGYERGILKEQTFTDCANYLISNGYEMIDIYTPWCRALYKRT